MNLLKKFNQLFLYQNDVNEICREMFNYTGLSYFHFRRTFFDGSYIILGTDANWPLYFIEKQVPVTTPVADCNFNNRSYFCPWKGNIPDVILADADNYYGIKSAIAYVELNKNYFDSFSFGSGRNDIAVEMTYLNNIDVFSKFSGYFRDQASLLIKKFSAQPVIVQESLRDCSLARLASPAPAVSQKDDFLKAITPERLTLLSKNGSILLTKREAECIQHLACGKNKKVIGNILGLSSRTVETHLDKAQLKAGCNGNSELVDLWWENFS